MKYIQSFDFTVYPNPFTCTFILTGGTLINKDYTITAFDVRDHAVSQNTTIDLSGYAKGAYVIQVKN
ncbi:MAG: T9SS type A sorting domain-containing protein [Chitinophagales bacterium]